MPETYVRVQATYRGRLGVEVGVFVAVDHLRRAGVLTDAEQDAYLDVDDWFHEHLPNPDFYADGNTIGAVTWFRTPLPAPMQERIDRLGEILRAHDVPFEVAKSSDPGSVVYEDDFQVGVVPYTRAQPTPMPEGVTHAPTSAGSKRGVAASPIRHVLFDADGVLQTVPGGWYSLMEAYVGERSREFLHRAWKAETPLLAGQGEYLPFLAELLTEFGVMEPANQVYSAVWHRIDRVPESVALVEALRRNGYGVHLGSNQERERAAYMRTELGYDDLFDTSCYSSDLGVIKPDPQFFVEAARRIGTEPETILFIDDTPENVEGARSVGLAAVHWKVGDGQAVLLDLLAEHGVDGHLTAG